MYDFKNKAIECSTWEQMEHLAVLAKAYGYIPSACFSKYDFERNGCVCFGTFKDGHQSKYNNYQATYGYISNFEKISYSTFIAQHTPDVSQIVASINIH